MKLTTYCVTAFMLLTSYWGFKPAAAQETESESEWTDEFDAVLDVRISSYSCEDCDLRTFRKSFIRQTRVAACLSEWQSVSSEIEPTPIRIDIDVSDATPREILDIAMAQCPGYMWLPTHTNIVNIVPVDEAMDHESRSNMAISFSTGGAIRLSEAVYELMKESYSTGMPLTGIVGGGFDYRGEPLVDVSLENVSFMEAMNAIFAAAGPGYAYLMSGKFMTWGSFSPEKVELTSHQVAQAATEWYDMRQKYIAAIDEAPYAALKMRIASEYANKLIGRGGAELEEGMDILYSILPDIPEAMPFPNTTQAVVEGILKGLRRSGRHAEGTEWLIELIESGHLNESEQSPSHLGAPILYRALIGMQIDPSDTRTSIEGLLGLRNVLPDREGFHSELENRIVMKNAQLEAELALTEDPESALVQELLSDNP